MFAYFLGTWILGLQLLEITERWYSEKIMLWEIVPSFVYGSRKSAHLTDFKDFTFQDNTCQPLDSLNQSTRRSVNDSMQNFAAHYQRVNSRNIQYLRDQSLSVQEIICSQTAISARFLANFIDFSSSDLAQARQIDMLFAWAKSFLLQRNVIESWIISWLPNYLRCTPRDLLSFTLLFYLSFGIRISWAVRFWMRRSEGVTFLGNSSRPFIFAWCTGDTPPVGEILQTRCVIVSIFSPRSTGEIRPLRVLLSAKSRNRAASQSGWNDPSFRSFA